MCSIYMNVLPMGPFGEVQATLLCNSSSLSVIGVCLNYLEMDCLIGITLRLLPSLAYIYVLSDILLPHPLYYQNLQESLEIIFVGQPLDQGVHLRTNVADSPPLRLNLTGHTLCYRLYFCWIDFLNSRCHLMFPQEDSSRGLSISYFMKPMFQTLVQFFII